MKPLKLVLILALAFSPLAIAGPALADKAPVWTSFGSNVAIKGYDPVAFFQLVNP